MWRVKYTLSSVVILPSFVYVYSTLQNTVLSCRFLSNISRGTRFEPCCPTQGGEERNDLVILMALIRQLVIKRCY